MLANTLPPITGPVTKGGKGKGGGKGGAGGTTAGKGHGRPVSGGGGLAELQAIFGSGETGDYWRFNSTNTDASVDTDPISDATGLVNGLSLSQATGADQPTLTTLDGIECALFDGAGDKLIHNFGSTIAQPGTLIIAFQTAATGGTVNTYALATGSGTTSRWQISGNSSNQLIAYAGTELPSTYTNAPGRMVFTGIFNGASTIIRVNGAESAVGNAGTQSTDQLTIGNALVGDDDNNDARYFFSALFIDRVLTSTELAYVENLMATDAGLDISDKSAAVATALSGIFGGGDIGDVWVFSPDNVDNGRITEVTGLFNGLVLDVGDTANLPRLRLLDGQYWAVYFQSNSRLFHNFGSTISQPGTIVLAVRNNDTSTHVMVTGSSSGSRWQIYNNNSDDIKAFAGVELDSTFNSPIGDAVLDVEFNGGASIFRRNGTLTGSGNAGSQGTDQITFGADWAGGTSGLFYLAGVLAINRSLTTGERDAVESAFADLLGITI